MTAGAALIICASSLFALRLILSVISQTTKLRKNFKALQERDIERIAKWNQLISRINNAQRRHGVMFEDYERGAWPERTFMTQFSKNELVTLRRLCHPDKHNNNASASAITQKLNSLIK